MDDYFEPDPDSCFGETNRDEVLRLCRKPIELLLEESEAMLKVQPRFDIPPTHDFTLETEQAEPGETSNIKEDREENAETPRNRHSIHLLTDRRRFIHRDPQGPCWRVHRIGFGSHQQHHGQCQQLVRTTKRTYLGYTPTIQTWRLTTSEGKLSHEDHVVRRPHFGWQISGFVLENVSIQYLIEATSITSDSMART